MGFEQPIETNGVFPLMGSEAEDSTRPEELERLWEGWENWPSADEEHQDLLRLIREAEQKGFCEIVDSEQAAVRSLGGRPILNKLGVVVKFQGAPPTKKSRIIWDLRESGVSVKCNPAERVVLPRLLDVVHATLDIMRDGDIPIFAAVDVRDAFHNVPAGSDRRFSVAATELEDGTKVLVIYNVLVFVSKSSPTIWGRFAALLGRILACTVPETPVQIYVDDPIVVVPRSQQQHVKLLTLFILTTRLFGFPLKLSKAAAGTTVKWMGHSYR